MTEIDETDQLVRLTSTQVPPPPEVGVASRPKPRPPPSSISPLENLLSEEIMICLQRLAEEVKRTQAVVEERVELGMFIAVSVAMVTVAQVLTRIKRSEVKYTLLYG